MRSLSRDIKLDGTLYCQLIEVPEIMIASKPESREKDYLSQE